MLLFRVAVISVLICSLNGESTEEPNPFLDAAKSFLEEAIEKNPEISKSSGMSTLSGILHTFKNTDANQLGDLLSSFNIPSSQNVVGDILTGVAGMLNKNSQGGGGGFDPAILGQVADVISSLANKDNQESENEIPNSSGPDWGAVLGLASNLLNSAGDNKNSQQGQESLVDLVQGGGLEGLMNLLPLMTGSAPSGHVHFADHDLEDEAEHKKSQKSNYLPPFMHIVYEYWDMFKKSELGEAVWKKSGLESIFQLFVDKEGYFQVDRIFESMENTSFRRRWISSLSSFVAQWVKHISDPATQARYMGNLKFLGQNFLQSQGYPKSVQFDPARPSESAAIITDAVLKKHFGLKVDSGKYIKPSVLYIRELFKLGEKQNILNFSHLSSQQISSKLAEVLNGELIEPILRVWRAYKFSIQHRECDKRLICFLNQKNSPSKRSGLQPGVTKLSSLIASWYLSGRTATPFWKLYNAATEDHICETQYPADCQLFFDQERMRNGHDGEEL